MPTLAPRVIAFRDEADRDAPGRRRDSDGGYVNKPGGHNIGARGLVHAYDLGQCMPGTPYWKPEYQQFDVWSHCYQIAAEYTAAGDAQRQLRWPWLYDGGYMVWFDGTKDIIFGPKHDRDLGQGPHIRQNGDFKTEHFQHAHFEAAETVRAENDRQPIFGASQEEPDMPLNKDDIEAIRQIVKATVEDAIGGASLSPPDPHATVVDVVKHYAK